MTPLRRFEPHLIIFDCDGVLVDSEPLAFRALAETFGEIGVAIDVDSLVDEGIGLSFPAFLALVELRTGTAVADGFPHDAHEARRVALFGRELCAMPGAAEALAALPVPACVASSSHPARIAHSLAVSRLADFFGDRTYSATEVRRGKPAPDLFLHAAGRLGVAPADCLVVEDSPHGVAAARAAGMPVIGFAGGGHMSEAVRMRLAASGPDLILEEMAGLGDLLSRPAPVR